MGYSSLEFDKAFLKARENHPTISRALGETVMKKFVERWENDRSKPSCMREGFGPLIRLTLNELKISGKPTRQIYAALVGHYYGRHAVYVNARRSKTPRLSKPAVARAQPYATSIGTNGQLAWQL